MHPTSNQLWWAAIVAYLVAALAAALIVRFRSVQQRALFGTIFFAVVCGFANVIYPFAAVFGYTISAIGALGILVWALYDRRFESARWLERARGALVLQPPFEGTWRVAAGGPDPKHNHHQTVSDQYFAYDFLKDDGESWDAPILSPVRGMVAHVEDRHNDAPAGSAQRDRVNPAGNYVSIETARGYVILAHLKRGSIAVRNGQPVGPGDPVGRCGNSGNTGGAHLHVHAQDGAFMNVGVAQGIPIAFVGRGGGEPLLLEFGDRLG